MKDDGNLACSDHEIVEFKILRGVSRVKRKLSALDFRRTDQTCLGICLEQSHGIRPCREEGLNRMLPAKLTHKKEVHRRWKQRQVTQEKHEGTVQACRDMVRKARAYLETNW